MIRRGDPRDLPFLRDMLRHAYYWRAAEAVAADDLLARYVTGWGRRGDAAVIALEESWPIGAAWYRLFSRDNPGFGFVDEETPELTIAVVPSRRGRGHGKELLAALVDRARADGYRAVSLSVERDSPPVALYQRFGFATVAEAGGALTMRAELGP